MRQTSGRDWRSSSPQGHPQSGRDVGRTPEENPQQRAVHEGPDEPDHVGGGVTPGALWALDDKLPCTLLQPLRMDCDLHTDCDFRSTWPHPKPPPTTPLSQPSPPPLLTLCCLYEEGSSCLRTAQVSVAVGPGDSPQTAWSMSIEWDAAFFSIPPVKQ